MNSVPFAFDGEMLTVYLKNKPHEILRTNANFRAVKNALKNGTEAEIEAVVHGSAPAKNLANYFSGSAKVEVRDGQVYYNGEVLFNNLTKRIVQYVNEDLPHEPLLKFLENVMQNPSFNSRKELFDFLEYEHLPITDDGHFLGYKAIRADWKDKYTGRIDNSIGQRVSMPREKVDDNTNNGCSSGLHVGTLRYATTYAGSGDMMVIVKVNPRDAVSVPRDSSCEKLRTCAYTVVSKYADKLDAYLYDSYLQPVRGVEVSWDDMDGDEWDDEDDFDDFDTDEDEYWDDEEDETYDVEDVTSEEVEVEEVKVNPTYHNLRDKNGKFKKKPRRGKK